MGNKYIRERQFEEIAENLIKPQNEEEAPETARDKKEDTPPP